MTLSRSDQDWAVLLNEYNICKKKLQSKREGLKILVTDLEQAQIERDIQKNKATQLQSELSGLKEVLNGCWRDDDGSIKFQFNGEDKKIKTLSSLLQFSRDENVRYQHDFDNLRQLYSESQRDNQLLRVSLSKYEAQKKVGLHNKHDKEKLIQQLEESIAKISVLEEELQLKTDELKELNEERTAFREKYTRLNAELNYILHNDDRRIVDIDSLVLENQYLKEVVKQYKEERSVALGTAARYKDALKQRQSSPAKSRLSYLDLVSPPSKSSFEGFFSKSFNQNTLTDLHRVNQALTEKLTEKEVALKHQRNTNRILGTRVSELEKKLKTLEISGLWSHEQRLPRTIPGENGLPSELIQPMKAAKVSPDDDKDTDLRADAHDDSLEENEFSVNSIVQEGILVDMNSNVSNNIEADNVINMSLEEVKKELENTDLNFEKFKDVNQTESSSKHQEKTLRNCTQSPSKFLESNGDPEKLPDQNENEAT